MKTCTCNIKRFFFQKKILKISLEKKNRFFNITAQNIHCGYTLEQPRRGGSDEYPQCMFWIKIKQKRYTPANPQFFYIKVGIKGVYIARTFFSDEKIKS